MTSCTASSQLMDESGDRGMVLITAGRMSHRYMYSSSCSWGSTSFLASRKFHTSPWTCLAGCNAGGAPNVTQRTLLHSSHIASQLLSEPCMRTKEEALFEFKTFLPEREGMINCRWKLGRQRGMSRLAECSWAQYL